MLRNILNPVLFQIRRTCAAQLEAKCASQSGEKVVFNVGSNLSLCRSQQQQQQARWLRTASRCWKDEDRRSIYASVLAKDEGVDGEKSYDLDAKLTTRSFMFPDEDTPNQVIDGVRFSELPIIHIKSTKNNTIIGMTDYKGGPLLLRSCGMEGFKNAKKGTNIAAQATAINAGMKALEMGIKNVRVKIGGLGPGRMSSIKGLQMAGINIVSISDITPAEEDCPRPRKARRL